MTEEKRPIHILCPYREETITTIITLTSDNLGAFAMDSGCDVANAGRCDLTTESDACPFHKHIDEIKRSVALGIFK